MFLECWEIWFLLPEGFLKYMLDSVGTGGFNMDTTQTWTPGTDKGNGQGKRTGTPGILAWTPAWTWMLFMDMETGHEHEHRALTCTPGTDMNTEHRHGHRA